MAAFTLVADVGAYALVGLPAVLSGTITLIAGSLDLVGDIGVPGLDVPSLQLLTAETGAGALAIGVPLVVGGQRAELHIRTDELRIVRIPLAADVTMQGVWVREFIERHWPTVSLRRLDRTRSYRDETTRAEAIQRVHSPTLIELRAYPDPNPEKQTLERFGVEDARDLLVLVSTLHLSDLGLLSQSNTFLVGDLILFDGDPYEIRVMYRDKKGYWATSNVPFFYALVCTRYRIGE